MSATKLNGTAFTEKNIRLVDSSFLPKYKKIDADKEDLIYSPTETQKRGLQETATRYGRKLNSGYMIKFNAKLRRLSTICFSNSGTNFFIHKGEMIVVS